MSNINDAHENRIERLRYIQALLGELRTLSEAERCNMLTYMIEMAYVEASDILRGQRPMRISPSDDKGSDQRSAVA